MENRSYTISIRNSEFTFICSDGQDHVDKLEECLNRWVDRLYPGSTLPHMSDFAFKLAISLADEAISQSAAVVKQADEFNERLTPLLDKLDESIVNTSRPQEGQANADEELERPVIGRAFESDGLIE